MGSRTGIFLLAGGMLVSGLAMPHAADAAVVDIRGGETTVEVTAGLAGLGLGASEFGSAKLDTDGANPVFTFPITGGFLDTGGMGGEIEHEGSGVTMTALADSTVSATVGNFLIDLSDGTVFGDIIGGPEDVAFFSLGTAGSSGIPLLITSDLAGALTTVFGASDLTGAEFGLANTSPQVVPVPAAAGLLATALALLGGIGLRRLTPPDAA